MLGDNTLIYMHTVFYQKKTVTGFLVQKKLLHYKLNRVLRTFGCSQLLTLRLLREAATLLLPCLRLPLTSTPRADDYTTLHLYDDA